ncbi:MAG TPA: sigma-70 family RNA polymerase sigma factor [Aggregatilinea sp.]|uniref:sigma-70 family RNA polymerase sigma factor n=1 Tax=Aggregatilinea sp. TaxID=2806333 RepID=UPI002C87884C|nr:sigma-70 family RNA polymerase sigma factor [Aggregatilinea sp.]HML20018.1 sigma-70 family RNA polymerase sigma factor [Aggregatilinea sp.]
MDEFLLIQAARRGDVESFNTLVLAYQDMAFSVAYRVMGESEAAADATQEAFISAFKKLDQFRGDQFKAWLMRIVTNACYDELRRRQRRPAASLDTLQDEAPQAELALLDDDETPEQRLQRAELNQAIQDCLTDLPTDQRMVAVLADVEGYAYQEIADMTGSSLGTVKSRLSRARTRLRDCLQGAEELLPAKYRLISE